MSCNWPVITELLSILSYIISVDCGLLAGLADSKYIGLQFTPIMYLYVLQSHELFPQNLSYTSDRSRNNNDKIIMIKLYPETDTDTDVLTLIET